MNGEKVTLPSSAANAIRSLRILGKTNEEIAELWMRTGGGVPAIVGELREVSFDTLAAALVNGFETDVYAYLRRVHEEHRNGVGKYDTGPEDDAFADGIEFALNEAGINIKGVNA